MCAGTGLVFKFEHCALASLYTLTLDVKRSGESGASGHVYIIHLTQPCNNSIISAFHVPNNNLQLQQIVQTNAPMG